MGLRGLWSVNWEGAYFILTVVFVVGGVVMLIGVSGSLGRFLLDAGR